MSDHPRKHLRTCEASGHNWYFSGWFHRWLDPREEGGVVRALVENEDGTVSEIDAHNFKFTD